MIRRFLVLALVVLVVWQPVGAQQAAVAPASPALSETFKAGSVVRVELKDGTRVRGRLMLVTADALHVRPEPRDAGSTRVLSLADITSVELEPRRNIARKIFSALEWTVLVTLAAIGFGFYIYIANADDD
jgi:hypothetical protein